MRGHTERYPLFLSVFIKSTRDGQTASESYLALPENVDWNMLLLQNLYNQIIC